MIKIILYALVEIILGTIILYFNLKAFLLYFLIVYFINSHLRTESLAKAIRMQTLFNTISACATMQKLGITNEELEQSISGLKAKTDIKNWELLMKDIKEITGTSIIDFYRRETI
jgi:hypothetical protein